MKKLLAIIIVCVLSANAAVAQNAHRRPMMRPHFENLDSAMRKHFMTMSQESWKKRVKTHEKRWGKHLAWGRNPMMGNGQMSWPGFKLQPQEQMPEFVGGNDALRNWIEENITYPILADANNVEGKVVVSFEVNNDGSVGNVKVEESVNPILDQEVVSVVETMPNWIPAKQNGRNVKVRYTLPINFVSVS